MSKNSSEKITTSKTLTILYIESLVLIILGILFACSFSVGDILDYSLGALLLIFAIFELVLSIVKRKSVISVEGLFAAFAGSLAIICFSKKIFNSFFNDFAIWFLIVLGSLIILNAIYGFIVKRNTFICVVELAIGVVSLTLGLLLYFLDDFRKYSSIVFGVIFIVLGIALLVVAILRSRGKRIK